jgi:hypothetical protein
LWQLAISSVHPKIVCVPGSPSTLAWLTGIDFSVRMLISWVKADQLTPAEG